MRGRLTYFGLALLLVGLVCVVFGAINLSNVSPKAVSPGESVGVWNITRNLENGRTYRLEIESGDGWGTPFAKGDFTEQQPVNVTITSPTGGNTSLQAWFLGLETSSPYYQEGEGPTVVEVTYQNVDETGVRVETSSTRIRFTARLSGEYVAYVHQEGLWSDVPPLTMAFYEDFVENREAYVVVASAGGIAGTGGGVIFLVNAFKRETAKHKKTRR